MIRVIVGNNVSRETKNVDELRTLRSVIEEAGLDVSRHQMTLNSTMLSAADYEKTFADFGFSGNGDRNSCSLLQVAKLDNA